MSEIDEILKSHYQGRRLPDDRVDRILESCDPARRIRLWKSLALTSFGAAAAAILALLFVLAAHSHQPENEPPLANGEESEITLDALSQPERFRLIAVKIHADPCGRCKRIAPVFADLQNEFSDDSVLFLTFDLTTEGSRRQAEFLSKIIGIEEIFKKQRYTGVIVVATPDGEVREVVDSSASLAGATEVLARNLNPS